jgi:hypothetical protein
MVARVNRQILLKNRPEGVPSLDNFVLKQSSVPEPGDGEVLMRTRWLSLDPASSAVVVPLRTPRTFPMRECHHIGRRPSAGSRRNCP